MMTVLPQWARRPFGEAECAAEWKLVMVRFAMNVVLTAGPSTDGAAHAAAGSAPSFFFAPANTVAAVSSPEHLER